MKRLTLAALALSAFCIASPTLKMAGNPQDCESTCWGVSVKFTVNDSFSGPPAYSTRFMFLDDYTFANRVDAEAASAALAVNGFRLKPDGSDESQFVPPSRIDSVTVSSTIR